jgi:hypothetical protein
MARHRFTFAQRAWHDAGFLSGTISEEKYRAQPYKVDLEDRWHLLRALRADLTGTKLPAVRTYRQCICPPSYHRDEAEGHEGVLESRTVQEFVTWRLAVLSSD